MNATAGNDTLLGTAMDDLISGLGGDDSIDGLAGSDSLNGNDGNDNLNGGEGNDLLNGGTGINYIDGGSGIDSVILNYSTLTGSIEHDGYAENYGSTYSYESDQDIHYHENVESINLTGTNFDDTISASGVNDTLDGGDGSDHLSLGLFNQTDNLNVNVDFTIANNQVTGINGIQAKNFELIGGIATGSGDDTISLANTDANFGWVDGGEGIDFLSADFSTLNQGINYLDILDIESINLIGTEFDDTLNGINLADTLNGGDGTDLINLDLNRETDNLNIEINLDNAENQVTVDNTPLAISNFEKSNITGGEGEDVIILNYSNLSGSIALDTFNLEHDGNIYSLASVYSYETDQYIHDHQDLENINITGTSSDDTLIGGIGRDTIDGSSGNDQLQGGDGNDVLRGNDGNDTLNSGAENDTLNGGSGDDILAGNGGDDTLNGEAGSDRLYVASENKITLTDTEVIGDGTDTIVNIESASLVGRDNNSIIDASNTTNIETIIKGNGGYDTLRGGEKNDTILGGYGNDILFGNGGDDILYGQGGTDRLYVDADNNMTLTDTEVIGDGTDTISQIEFANLNGGAGDNDIRAGRVTNIQTVLRGNDGNDTLNGGAKNDTLNGGNGDDTLAGNGGDDTLNGEAGSDRLYVASDNQITLTDTEVIGDGTDTIVNIESASLVGRDNNSIIDASSATNISVLINANGGADTLNGGDKNDTLNGGNGNDILIGNGGNDLINGQGGTDRLYVDADNNMTLTDTEVIGDGTDTITNIEYANLSGGAGDNDIRAGRVTNIQTVLRGNDGNDTLNGGAKNDTLNGGSGDDTLAGNGGNDTLKGEAGSDRLYVASDTNITLTDTQVTGDGTDTIVNIESASLVGRDNNSVINAETATNIETIIHGNGGFDTLQGGEQSDTILGGSGNDVLRGNAGDDLLHGQGGIDRLYVDADNDITLTDTEVIGDGTDTISQIEFANLNGGAGDNDIRAGGVTNIQTVLRGNDGNDTLNGGEENDTLNGGAGDDILAGHDGNDILNGEGGTDRLYVASDTNITLTDTQVTGDGTDTITNIELASLVGRDNNSLINASSATNISVLINANGGADTLNGGAKNDTLNGGNGNDILVGNGGNDLINGQGGSDRLFGGTGDDRLSGGNGNDTLNGGAGADIFILETVLGTDVINDFSDGVDSFGLSASLSLNDLSITDNAGVTATLITDTTNNNQLLAIINNVSAADITVDDFISI